MKNEAYIYFKNIGYFLILKYIISLITRYNIEYPITKSENFIYK